MNADCIDVTAIDPSLKLQPMTDTAAEPNATKTKPRSGGTKETIESILVAFILAFVFRAFVFEAFVIPTGSMATTLLGAHTRFECPDCGYKFDINYSSPNPLNETDEGDVPDKSAPITTPIYCPNCGFQIPKSQTDSPTVFYGDRILVLKYLYLLTEPRRWDVVVFKPPTQLSQNFIKRLIGKPGEAVLILDGDIWIRPADAKNPTDFSIATKPADVQPAMWRLVYDNDYHPHLKDEYRVPVTPWTQPWKHQDGTGWNTQDPGTDGRALLFENTAGHSTLRFDPNANITAQTTSDYLVHDQSSPGMPLRDGGREKDIPVSDLDLRVTYERTSGAGPLELKLTKREHRFRAVVLPGSVSLFDDCEGKSTQVGTTFTLAAGTDPVRIELSNADYHAALRVNDKVVAETTPQTYAPDLNKLLAEYEKDVNSGTVSSAPPGIAEITAGGQACRLTHVSLWRDLYYYNRDVSVLQGVRWGTPKDFPKDVQQLGPDEYFTMGDNSLVSFDARIWPTGLDLPEEDIKVAAGRVPGRFLLGKAFYVYWPAGHSINPSLPALVPNFGSMRFIH